MLVPEILVYIVKFVAGLLEGPYLHLMPSMARPLGRVSFIKEIHFIEGEK